jgi:hypothetical protein
MPKRPGSRQVRLHRGSISAAELAPGWVRIFHDHSGSLAVGLREARDQGPLLPKILKGNAIRALRLDQARSSPRWPPLSLPGQVHERLTVTIAKMNRIPRTANKF